MARFVTVLLILVLVAGCAHRGQFRVLPSDAPVVGEATTVFLASTRGPITGNRGFGFDRHPSARFARYEISVPPVHEAGKIEWPRKRDKTDPSQFFLTRSETVFPDDLAFRRDVGRVLAGKPRSEREAIVFVHGFNTTFAEGLYRIAQLGHDLKVPGLLVHYAWPSRANPLGYAYDRDSALFARDGLESLLGELSASGVERIVIVAHSMGSAITMEALRQISLSGRADIRNRIAGVVLISPDIDIDVFRAQAQRIGKLPQPFLIFSSKRDRALALAARLTGERERLGNIRDVSEIADLKVTVLDVSAFSEGIGHFNLGNSPALISLLNGLQAVDAAFSEDQAGHTGLLPGAVLTVQNATQIILSPVSAIAGVGTLGQPGPN